LFRIFKSHYKILAPTGSKGGEAYRATFSLFANIDNHEGAPCIVAKLLEGEELRASLSPRASCQPLKYQISVGAVSTDAEDGGGHSG